MITPEEKTQIEERIVDVLKTVYDPEIPVDIWNLGMIYKIDVKDDASVGRRQIGGCQPRLRTHLGPKHDVGRSPGGAGIRLAEI